MNRTITMLSLLPILALASACAHLDEPAKADAATQAVAGSTARVGAVRVLSRRVNLREPLRVDVEGADVTVAFGVGPRAGVTMALDPRSLAPHHVAPYDHPSRAARAEPPYMPLVPVRVGLEGGGSVACWNDGEASRLMVQVYDESGASRGEPMAVSVPGLDVFGAPRAATVDGRHVVVAFFASDAEGFSLVATTMEVPL